MIDYRKLYQVFTEEAREHIAGLETGLLDLEKSCGDKELLNVIFRAAHTIKGSSGSLGLTDISGFTHNMEEVLELVRQEKLVPEKQLINILLEATDRLREMIDAVASDSTFDFKKCGDLVRRMEAYKNSNIENSFKIIFVPEVNLFRRGLDPAILLNDLRKLGEVTSIKTNTDNVPLLSELDPEGLYLRWDIMLRTTKNEDEIKKVFEFAEEGSEIKILSVSEKKGTPPLLGQVLIDDGVVSSEDISQAVKEQKKLGEILVEKGRTTHKDIEKALEKQSSRKIESFRNSVSSTIRVDLRKLDQLVNAVGEMVIIHSMFQQVLQTNTNGNGKEMTERLGAVLSQLQRIGSDIQENTMSLRMLPVGDVFQRFTRLVRELSAAKSKNINLVITGEETELDKGVLEKIADPLVHLIRNSIDHGIETAEERETKGKQRNGMIHLSAFQMGDSVYIEVEDDGRGLNREKIAEKAVSKGILNSTEGLTDEQIFNLIFLPGFSTADAVTDISGRGVGMDVVKKNIDALKGKVYIRTKQDEGTTISIKLPLTLAIIDGLKVMIGEDVFVIPITSVLESLRPAREDVRTLEEKGEVIQVRGEFIPLVRLYEALGVRSWQTNPWEAIVVLVAHENRKQCLLVDDLLGEQQVVIKNLGKATPKLCDIAGGTILGDGKVALVLDVPGIIENASG